MEELEALRANLWGVRTAASMKRRWWRRRKAYNRPQDAKLGKGGGVECSLQVKQHLENLKQDEPSNTSIWDQTTSLQQALPSRRQHTGRSHKVKTSLWNVQPQDQRSQWITKQL